MTDNPRMNLCEQGQERRWNQMIDRAISILERHDSRIFTEYELAFVNDMIRRNREERPLWSPTRKQWNMLHDLVTSI